LGHGGADGEELDSVVAPDVILLHYLDAHHTV
jgi:hypothetical protein